jgi:hypothetical protein
MVKTKYIDISETNKELTIIINNRRNYFMLIISGLWLLGWTSILFVFFFGFMFDKGKIDNDFFVIIPLYLIAGIIVTKIFFWQVAGKEQIKLTKDNISITKLGTILVVPSKFETNLVDNFIALNSFENAYWKRLYGFSGGLIKFNYLDTPKYFGLTLNNEEAKVIVEKINSFNKTTTH